MMVSKIIMPIKWMLILRASEVIINKYIFKFTLIIKKWGKVNTEVITK